VKNKKTASNAMVPKISGANSVIVMVCGSAVRVP
jgi:hypothetical protein